MHEQNRSTFTITLNRDGSVRPFAISRRDALRVVGSERLLKRMISTASDPDPSRRWVEYAKRGGMGAESWFVVSTLETACERLRRGEMPPLLDYEQRRRSELGAACRQSSRDTTK